MGSMIYVAKAFDQNLGTWKLNNLVVLDNMLGFSGLSCTNYDKTLIGWNDNDETPNNIKLLAYAMKYFNSNDARNNLINVKNWNIIGDTFISYSSTNAFDNKAINVFKIYPNPTNDYLNIEMQEPARSGLTFRISDLTGRNVLEKQTVTGSQIQNIDARNLSSGFYFLQVISDGKVIAVEKVMKD